MSAELHTYSAYVKLAVNALEAVGTDCLTGGAVTVCASLARLKIRVSLQWMALVKPLNCAPA